MGLLLWLLLLGREDLVLLTINSTIIPLQIANQPYSSTSDESSEHSSTATSMLSTSNSSGRD